MQLKLNWDTNVYVIEGKTIHRGNVKTIGKSNLKPSEYDEKWFTDIGKAKRFLKELHNAPNNRIFQVKNGHWVLKGVSTE